MSDAGYQLALAATAPERLRSELDQRVRLYMHDVRAMLMLPAPACGISAGCNFAAAAVLLNVLSGLSRLLMPSPSNSGDAFNEFVDRWYPWNCEPEHKWIETQTRTRVLYESFRNGLAHDLMNSVKQDKRYGWALRQSGRRRGIKKPSVDAASLTVLDDVCHRPTWLGPTLGNIDTYNADGTVGQRDVIALDVHALYWGIRRMLYDWSDDLGAVAYFVELLDRADGST
jgi:hypothetical protein